MARSSTNAIKLAQWQQRLARWRHSKLSVAEFCRREQLSPPLFYHWRRRLQSTIGNTPAQPFVELPTLPRTPGPLLITLPGGATVSLPIHASRELIATVLQAVATMQPPGEDPSC